MKISRISILAGIITLILSACQPEIFGPEQSIPEQVAPYVEAFVEEARTRGEEISINNLRIHLGGPLKAYGAAGICLHNSSNNTPTIYLDTTTLNWKNSKWSREVLIFHELAHCLLKRGHSDALLPNGNIASIMRSGGDPLYGDLNLYKRKYYLDELFNPGTTPPIWSREEPGYHVSPSDEKISIFEERFENNLKRWPESNEDSAIIRLSNGTYFLANREEGAVMVSKNISFDPSRDFEAELNIKILSGDTPALLHWGEENSQNRYYLGFNRQKYVIAGKFGHGNMSGRPFPNIVSNAYNRLTIRKSANNYHFFINGQYFDSFTYEPLSDSLWGFYIGSYAAVYIDSFKINYL